MAAKWFNSLDTNSILTTKLRCFQKNIIQKLFLTLFTNSDKFKFQSSIFCHCHKCESTRNNSHPKVLVIKKQKTPSSTAILPTFSRILVTTMIYSSVLVLVCAISMVSSTSTQQEVREKVEEPQWKVGDCILGKKQFCSF